MTHVCNLPGWFKRFRLGILCNAPVLSIWTCECGQSWRWISHGWNDDRKWIRISSRPPTS